MARLRVSVCTHTPTDKPHSEMDQLQTAIAQLKETRVTLERRLNALKGTDKNVSEGDEQSRRQAVAKQVKELEESIAAKQRSLAGLERLIAGYASDPAAQCVLARSHNNMQPCSHTQHAHTRTHAYVHWNYTRHTTHNAQHAPMPL